MKKTDDKKFFEEIKDKDGKLLGHIIDFSKANTIQQPEYYAIDFTRVTSFNELILILSTLKAGITLYPEDYENSPIKIFLTKTK